MKKLVCLLVLSVAVMANAGSITGFDVQSAAPNTGGGYIYNDAAGIGNESRTIIWDALPSDGSGWGDGHRNIGQNFTLDGAQTLKAYAFNMGPYSGENALYLAADSGFTATLYQLDADHTNYAAAGNSLVATWTGTMPQYLSATPGTAWSWMVMNFDTPVTLAAGTTYGMEIGWTSGGGFSAWNHRVTYGVNTNPEMNGTNWAVYTAQDPPGLVKSYTTTWRSGSYALITPEPATLALLSLGGLLLRRRSK